MGFIRNNLRPALILPGFPVEMGLLRGIKLCIAA
jgi:hypothetical protein